jgi:hypothetical protein
LPFAIRSSAAYGFGLGLSILITGLLYAVVDTADIGLRIPSELLIIGIGIALFIEALGSGVGGAIGALTLPLPPDKRTSQWGKAWRGGV